MFEHVHIAVVEVHPDFHSVEGLVILGRDEAEPVDVFAVLEVLSQKEEDQVGVKFVLVLLGTHDREDKAAAPFVVGVFPLGLDVLLEVLD